MLKGAATTVESSASVDAIRAGPARDCPHIHLTEEQKLATREMPRCTSSPGADREAADDVLRAATCSKGTMRRPPPQPRALASADPEAAAAEAAPHCCGAWPAPPGAPNTSPLGSREWWPALPAGGETRAAAAPGLAEPGTAPGVHAPAEAPPATALPAGPLAPSALLRLRAACASANGSLPADDIRHDTLPLHPAQPHQGVPGLRAPLAGADRSAVADDTRLDREQRVEGLRQEGA